MIPCAVSDDHHYIGVRIIGGGSLVGVSQEKVPYTGGGGGGDRAHTHTRRIQYQICLLLMTAPFFHVPFFTE